MTIKTKALLWAGAIIVAAIFANLMGLSSGASFGIIAGLSGAAVGALYGKRGKACG